MNILIFKNGRMLSSFLTKNYQDGDRFELVAAESLPERPAEKPPEGKLYWLYRENGTLVWRLIDKMGSWKQEETDNADPDE